MKNFALNNILKINYAVLNIRIGYAHNTLEISNSNNIDGYIGNNNYQLPCSALTPKLYMLKDIDSCLLDSYISLNKDEQLFIQTKQMQVNSLFGLNSALKNSRNKHYFEQILEHGRLEIYPPLQIHSTKNRKLLITLKDESTYYELICDSIKILDNKRIVVYYSGDVIDLLVDEINRSTVKSLNLCIKKGNTNDFFIELSINNLFSIESKGGINILKDPPYQVFTCHNWTPNKILFSEMNLKVDLPNKLIYGYYSESNVVRYARRSSSGWADKYHIKCATYYKNFEILHELRKYFNEIPKQLEEVDGLIQTNNLENTFIPNEFTIRFKDKMTFLQINEILNFTVVGYEYNEYFEVD
ncbi:MAG: hypothetical protein IKA83_04150 [Paludibacteraceae bacterium]|nr:hypothetical protein [Paludibacteraceae bacterium]